MVLTAVWVVGVTPFFVLCCGGWGLFVVCLVVGVFWWGGYTAGTLYALAFGVFPPGCPGGRSCVVFGVLCSYLFLF